MKAPAFRKVRSKDQDLMGLQDQTQGLANYLRQVPILDGILVTNIVITSGTEKSVSHQLGRDYQGYIVTGKSAEATIWDSLSDHPDREVILNASAN